MSSQGNIRVYVDNKDEFIFTTGRWSGGSTAHVVQECLDGFNYKFGYKGFLNLVSHHDHVYSPIKEVGNADTPTIVVHLDWDVVSWFEESTGTVIGEWSTDEYLRLDLESMDLWKKHFEG